MQFTLLLILSRLQVKPLSARGSNLTGRFLVWMDTCHFGCRRWAVQGALPGEGGLFIMGSSDLVNMCTSYTMLGTMEHLDNVFTVMGKK